MCLGAIDYAASYFKYKIPTPIRGVPNHNTIKRLKLELRSNGSSVETELGGGNHGYLGLVTTDDECATIPNTQLFVPPTFRSSYIPWTSNHTINSNSNRGHATKRRAQRSQETVSRMQ